MKFLLLLLIFAYEALFAGVKVGADAFFDEGLDLKHLKGKKVGLISNHTAINSKFKTTLELLRARSKTVGYELVALFAPEHGFFGDAYAGEKVKCAEILGVPLYSLHGDKKRPTKEMFKDIDVLIYDIQDIGSRTYTYNTTLFYCMEEAAKQKIKVLVFDRPNPLGNIVDGSLLDEEWRSFVGYIKTPYCHGMTVGELAQFFNQEQKVGCALEVISMQGWKRTMRFAETGLAWIPTSPQIPEMDTPFFYPTTGIIGQLSFVNIGVGYTLPFKVLGAPWINGEKLAQKLNEQKLPGVYFSPFYFRPYFGKFENENCQGIKISVSDTQHFLPVTTQFTIMGVLKMLYPLKFQECLSELMKSKSNVEFFHKINGGEEILKLLREEKYFIWKLREKFQSDRKSFLEVRKKYLNPDYDSYI